MHQRVDDQKYRPDYYDAHYWEKRRAQEETVLQLYLSGTRNIRKLFDITEIPMPIIRAIISKAKAKQRADAIQDQIIEEVMEDKVPLLKDIVGLSLTHIKEFLSENPNAVPDNIQDAKALSSLAKDLNDLCRLESGLSTQNVEIVKYSITQTQHIFEELKQIDPVFEYPELPAPKEKDVVPGS